MALSVSRAGLVALLRHLEVVLPIGISFAHTFPLTN